MDERIAIRIDGSLGEGGGQMLRTALGLSVLLHKPFRMENIRSGRPNPGLKAQHLTCIRALQDLCNAKVIGAKEGSPCVEFYPGEMDPRDILINIGTAGSITLVLQSLLIPTLFGKKRIAIELRGGTDVAWSTPIDYLIEVIVPNLRRYAAIKCEAKKRGYYPKGQGLFLIEIVPKYSIGDPSIPKISLARRGDPIMIKGIAHSSAADGINACEQMERRCHELLGAIGVPIEIAKDARGSASPGAGISLFAYLGSRGEVDPHDPQILGASGLGKSGEDSSIAEGCCDALMRVIEGGACADTHLADNLLPYIALCGGEMHCDEISEHLKANAHVIESFLGRCLEIDEKQKTVKRI